MDELLNYEFSRIADWLLIAGIVAVAVAAMIIMGFIWLKFTPTKHNCFYGYKTAIGKKDQCAWAYVNRMAGCLWLVAGVILGFVDAFVMLQCMHSSVEVVTGIGTLLMIIELALIGCCHIIICKISKRRYGTI